MVAVTMALGPSLSGTSVSVVKRLSHTKLAGGGDVAAKSGSSVTVKQMNTPNNGGVTSAGSRRIFPPHFKLQVLDSYRNDSDCKGNQRATARKYGIHRRQIQKWLQAETNLRNTVIGAVGGHFRYSGNNKTNTSANSDKNNNNSDNTNKMHETESYQHQVIKNTTATENINNCTNPMCHCNSQLTLSGRQLGDDRGCQPITIDSKRTPGESCSEPRSHNILPLDCTMRRDDEDIAMKPIDLSTRTRCKDGYVQLHHIPSPLVKCEYRDIRNPDDVWDLSLKSNRHGIDVTHQECSAKPVKLFKPYLLDDDCHKNERLSEDSNCKISSYNNLNTSTEYYYTCINNNNNPTYPMQDYYAYNNENSYGCDMSYISAPTIKEDPEDNYYFKHHHRQSYSLAFKLAAIETYYRGEEDCRGNQRAVANKYNVHRRQVQKWLQQEDTLRQRHSQSFPNNIGMSSQIHVKVEI